MASSNILKNILILTCFFVLSSFGTSVELEQSFIGIPLLNDSSFRSSFTQRIFYRTISYTFECLFRFLMGTAITITLSTFTSHTNRHSLGLFWKEFHKKILVNESWNSVYIIFGNYLQIYNKQLIRIKRFLLFFFVNVLNKIKRNSLQNYTLSKEFWKKIWTFFIFL